MGSGYARVPSAAAIADAASVAMALAATALCGRQVLLERMLRTNRLPAASDADGLRIYGVSPLTLSGCVANQVTTAAIS